MRESRPPGSVRGVFSNGHPYRDRTTILLRRHEGRLPVAGSMLRSDSSPLRSSTRASINYCLRLDSSCKHGTIAGGLPMRQPCSPKPGSEGMQVHAPGVHRTPKACFCNRLPLCFKLLNRFVIRKIKDTKDAIPIQRSFKGEYCAIRW